MITCNLLKLLFVCTFDNKIMSRIYFNIFWQSKIRLCNKTREMFSFLPLRNNSVTIRLNFLLLSISAIISSKTVNIL